jgi:hypothetical protein
MSKVKRGALVAISPDPMAAPQSTNHVQWLGPILHGEVGDDRDVRRGVGSTLLCK